MSSAELFKELLGLSRQEKFQAMQLLLQDLAMLELSSTSPKVQEEPKAKIRQAGSAQGLIHMADDFDAPLADFDEYMS